MQGLQLWGALTACSSRSEAANQLVLATHTPSGEPNQCLPPGAVLKPSQAAPWFGTIKGCLRCPECWLLLGFYCYLLFPRLTVLGPVRRLKMLRNAFSFQALSKSEAKGRIRQYTVTFEALNRGGSKPEVTTQTSYTRTTAKMDYKITVTADNSRGSSPPAVITTDLGIRGKGNNIRATEASRSYHFVLLRVDLSESAVAGV